VSDIASGHLDDRVGQLRRASIAHFLHGLDQFAHETTPYRAVLLGFDFTNPTR